MFQQVVGCYKIGALACSTLQVATKLEPFGDQVFSWNHAVLLHQSPQTCAMRILEKRKHEKTHATHKTLYIWLVVWNIWVIFPYIGSVIIPTDELHHFSEGWVYINQYIYICTMISPWYAVIFPFPIPISRCFFNHQPDNRYHLINLMENHIMKNIYLQNHPIGSRIYCFF